MAFMLSGITTANTPPKNIHAASSPAITSCSVWRRVRDADDHALDGLQLSNGSSPMLGNLPTLILLIHRSLHAPAAL
jgi:hypothetical protein